MLADEGDADRAPPIISTLGSGTLAGVPVPVIVVGVSRSRSALVLGRTQWGRWIYAVGGNPEAARRAGVPPTA